MVTQAIVILRHDTDFKEMCIGSDNFGHNIPTGLPIFVKFDKNDVEEGWFTYNEWNIRFKYCEQIMFIQ